MFPIFAGNSASTGYNLTRSLRWRNSASAYLSRTPATASNQKTWTWSGWVKRGLLGSSTYGIFEGGTQNNQTSIAFGGDSIAIQDYIVSNYNLVWNSSAVFRDPSAWYFVLVSYDTTQATASNAVKLYINGVQQTLTFTAYVGAYVQNRNSFVNYTVQQRIGTNNGLSSYLDAYLAEVNFIDGQALTPSSFGSTNALTGVWQPARYTGTYGTNGFYLPFTDNSALTTSSNVGLGKDFSGNGNYWTTNNISITAGVTYDSMTDVPTLTSATAANFCVMNPIDTSGTGSTGISITGGNLNLAGASSDWGAARATFGMTSGKWYWECTRTGASSVMFGIGLNSTTLTYAYTSTSYSYFSTGDKYSNNVSAAYGASFASGDVIGVAFDADAGTLTFYKNNTSQGTAYTGLTSGPYFPLNQNYTTTGTASINFGQRPFAYTPPTGFVALNTFNLPTGTILKGNTVMDATTYTGNGGTLAVTNAGAFKPDLVWLKSRSAAYDHLLFDSIRGTGKALFSSNTAAETTTNNMSAFNSNGFTALYDATYIGSNNSGVTMVGWQWQAGQGSSSSNTAGTITSTVSVNATAGFSIVTYTGNNTNGATVGHGLGVAPQFIITKKRDAVGTDFGWSCYHISDGNANIFLNSTAAKNPGNWNTAPTSSVFTPADLLYNNVLASTYVNYCWAAIPGFSAFGSYIGNGSTEGPFVYTGFRPRWILMKGTSDVTDWHLFDTARDPYNVSQANLSPNSSAAEVTLSTRYVDFLSNGFKLRTTANPNSSGVTFIYAAFAENPFKNSLAR